MGHLYIGAMLKGAEGTLELKSVLVDTGVSYTVMDLEAFEKIGAFKMLYMINVELGDGR